MEQSKIYSKKVFMVLTRVDNVNFQAPETGVRMSFWCPSSVLQNQYSAHHRKDVKVTIRILASIVISTLGHRCTISFGYCSRHPVAIVCANLRTVGSFSWVGSF